MPYKDQTAQREYQRKWNLKRRRDYFRGKSCINCGSKRQLELDHLDPATKVSHSIWTWSQKRREVELAKCQVLCKKCHRTKSSRETRNRQIGRPNQSSRILTTEQVQDILALIYSGNSNGIIAKTYNIGRTTVSNIRTGLSYKEVLRGSEQVSRESHKLESRIVTGDRIQLSEFGTP